MDRTRDMPNLWMHDLPQVMPGVQWNDYEAAIL